MSKPPATSLAFSIPHRSSTSVKAKSMVVPGPWLVTTYVVCMRR